MQASLSLALSLCLGCAATVPWSASLDRLPDLHARALVAGAGAFASVAQAGTRGAGRIAIRVLQDSPGVMDPTATVSEEEIQAWQMVAEHVAPEATLPVVTAQAWTGGTAAGAVSGGAAARWADARLR